MGAQMALFWPTTTDQRITQPYSAADGSLKIHAPADTTILAVANGTIAAVGTDSLHLTSDQLVVVYTGLAAFRVQVGQMVKGGDVIAVSGTSNSITLQVYQNLDPTDLFMRTPVATAAAATAARDDTPVYVTPLLDGLRVREQPVDGNPVGQLKLGESCESLEPAGVTHHKLGVRDQWLHIRRADGTTAFAAAWLLQATPKAPARVIRAAATTSLTGMNLDIHHPLGRPEPDSMQGIGWVRLKFNVSFNPDNHTFGNTDLEAAYQRYLPFIEQYAQAGLQVLMVFTHQLYGEGAGFDWTQMDSGRWRELVPTYADFARQVTARFAGTGLVHAYQIWNEQDTKPENARAAVPVPAADYGYMLTETIRAIRTVDDSTPVITGGHTTGPVLGPQYARETLQHMPPNIRPDGLALHPYGRGVKGHRFSNWGPLHESLDAYTAIMPDKPVWITEWGVLDHQGRADVIADVRDYAVGFMDIVKNAYPGRVAAAIWYAWADSMDNGFGLVDAQGQPKFDLHDKWQTLG